MAHLSQDKSGVVDGPHDRLKLLRPGRLMLKIGRNHGETSGNIREISGNFAKLHHICFFKITPFNHLPSSDVQYLNQTWRSVSKKHHDKNAHEFALEWK